MEALTKRIIAIVLIAVIGIGTGVGIWWFLSGEETYAWSAEDCPGAPTDITSSQIIRVGVISDTGRLHGENTENGAWLAAYEINQDGGVDVGGDTYYIGITSENSDEANPVLDTAVGVSAAKKLINYKKVQFAVGGFRTESVLAYQPLFMDKEIIFWNIGAATTALTGKVLSDYDNYKYFFQPSPINSTALAMQLIQLIMLSSMVQSGIEGHTITRFSFMREDLAWTAGFAALITANLESNDYWNMTFTGADIAFPQDVTPVEMEAHWDTIDGNHTQVVIPIISGSAGLTFATSYGDSEPECVPIGINVLAQDSNFWDDTSGRCEYGVTLESVFETNKTGKTIKFWNDYIDRFSDSPIYTAPGAYDSIYQLAWALEAIDSFDPDELVTQIETLKPGASLEGAGGNGAYDSSHSPYLGWPYGTSLAIQWYDEEKILVPGPGMYPSGLGLIPEPALLNISAFQLPDWGIYYFD